MSTIGQKSHRLSYAVPFPRFPVCLGGGNRMFRFRSTNRFPTQSGTISTGCRRGKNVPLFLIAPPFPNSHRIVLCSAERTSTSTFRPGRLVGKYRCARTTGCCFGWWIAKLADRDCVLWMLTPCGCRGWSGAGCRGVRPKCPQGAGAAPVLGVPQRLHELFRAWPLKVPSSVSVSDSRRIPSKCAR